MRVCLQGRPRDAAVSIATEPGGTPVAAVHRASVEADGDTLTTTYQGRTRRYRYAHVDGTTWLAADGQTWALAEHRLLADRGASSGRSDGVVTSPMPGTVLVADVAPGRAVHRGQRLFVVEAMKMEHTVTAPIDGVVAEVHARKGQSVGLDQPLAVLAAQEEA